MVWAVIVTTFVPEELANEYIATIKRMGGGLKSFQEDRGRIHNVKESELQLQI